MKEENYEVAIAINNNEENEKQDDKTPLIQSRYNHYDTDKTTSKKKFKSKYTSLYAKHNAHRHIQLFISTVRSYRYILNNNKYWLHFLRIGEMLAELYYIIQKDIIPNKQEDKEKIKNNVSNLSSFIQITIGNITALKKSFGNKHTELAELYSDLGKKQFAFVNSVKNALNNIPINTSEQANNDHIRSTKDIEKWIKDIRKPNREPWYHVFKHIYHHKKGLTRAAGVLFVLSVGGALQSGMAILAETHNVFTNSTHPTNFTTIFTNPTTTPAANQINWMEKTVNHFGLSATLSLFALMIFTYVIISTDQARRERRMRQIRAAKKFSYFVGPNHDDHDAIFEEKNYANKYGKMILEEKHPEVLSHANSLF